LTTQWRYTDETQAVVAAAFDDGHSESHLVTADCIQAWLAKGNTPLPYEPQPVDLKAQARLDLAASDGYMARIAEDLIAALIAKGLIAEADLPQSAHDKMARRSELREIVSGTE